MKEKHSKQKGIIGEIAVMKELALLDIPVFKEVGDLSRTDLIALLDGVAYKIQIKARTSNNGVVDIKNTKSGPNYSYKYNQNDVDIFAIYILDKDIVFFVSAEEFTSNKKQNTFRLDKPKAKNSKGFRYVMDYVSINDALVNRGSRTHDLL